jgi:uroporphyrin-3 C-methyltransferase
MNETIPTPDPQTPAATPRSGMLPPMAGMLTSPNRLLLIAVTLLALLLLAQWWNTRTALHNLRSEVASRLKIGDTINSETRVTSKALQDALREQQGKVSILESKQLEAQSQQLALEQLYQDLSKNRDDWALAEIEQVLSTASQQLQLAGNVQGALIALQNADARLSRSDKPQFITIRRAIAKDQDKLKSLPMLDMTGIALRIDSLINQIDTMPLLADEKPVVPASQPTSTRRAERAANAAKGVVERPSATSEWLGMAEDKWHSLSNELWMEMQQLIRIRSVNVPDALLLSPTQAYYARENLKLRLLNARMALLSRNETAFRSDLVAAQDAIAKYFDTRARQTQVTLSILKQVQSSNLSIEMPTLADSLNAVRNYKAKP